MKPEHHLRTSDLARAVGVHPNTIRLYEAWGFLPPVPRGTNGYRLFTEMHLDVARLVRTALQWPYPGGKQAALDLVHLAGAGDLLGALERAHTCLAQARAEVAHAEAAADVLERWASGTDPEGPTKQVTVRGVAQLLGVTGDMLRNWERNGLIRVPRDPWNGYRRYGAREIARLRVIRVLRQAGYSMMSILRMLRALDQGRASNLRQTLDTPNPEDDIQTATDRWLSTLKAQEQRALATIAQIETMIRKRQA